MMILLLNKTLLIFTVYNNQIVHNIGTIKCATSHFKNFSTDTFTVSQAINLLGFGKFQVKLSLFTGLCWMADSMEMTILSILSPTLHCEWGISRYQQALTTTVSNL